MSVVLVDWLGRGGIAQTTEAWALELVGSGTDAVVVTRPGRELGTGDCPVIPAPSRSGRLAGHRAVADHAAGVILQSRPDVVVVQNYVVPPLEAPVYRAAAEVGARTVVVVHDHRLHTPRAGTHHGLRHHLRKADVVVAHTPFVAAAIERSTGRSDVMVVPHPVPVGMLARRRSAVLNTAPGKALAIHFGVLARQYKGTDVFLELARRGVDGWRFALLGSGAPGKASGAQVVGGFVEAGALVDSVARSAATVLPYGFASQSGAVVLAQALRSAVVVSAVGGIPDQVEDGVTGRLIEPGAPVDPWHQALMELADEDARRQLTEAAHVRVWENHRRFTSDIATVVS